MEVVVTAAVEVAGALPFLTEVRTGLNCRGGGVCLPVRFEAVGTAVEAVVAVIGATGEGVGMINGFLGLCERDDDDDVVVEEVGTETPMTVVVPTLTGATEDV